ncbi:peptide chain release factor N(5)-glutamine methyltransferase [Parathalassolituus penaei]|uniref:peptide chain release factor N(5)-glutamine methyltransferase n=1 Tax=Parathalassolituus penaei TaxID=2997323 RepID=UPI003204CE52
MILTVRQWSQQATERMAAAGPQLQTDSPRVDADLLLMFVLGKTRTWLFSHDDVLLSVEQQQQAEQLLERRLRGEPVAYLTGTRGFWTLELEVSPATLIPRPDTETLVEWALELSLPPLARVLDLGTGTGAIALALASEQPSWQVSGVDLSAEAVELARRNAVRNDLGHVRFATSSWFSDVSGQFDLLVSNPPYIDPTDPHLLRGDVAHEPRSALVANDAGLADLFEIIDTAPLFLRADGWLLLEHGYDQADAVKARLTERGFANVMTRHDLGGNPRISGGRWPHRLLA